MSYSILRDLATGVVTGATRTADGAQIPADTLNRDWQAVVAWAAAESPPVSLATTGPTLAWARASRIADLDAWYAATVAPGVTVEGITLAADLASQNRFDALVTTLLAALTAGVMTSSDNTTLYDKSGTAHTMTVASALALMLGYASVLQGHAASYSTAQAAILAASNAEDALAVEMPD